MDAVYFYFSLIINGLFFKEKNGLGQEHFQKESLSRRADHTKLLEQRVSSVAI